MICRCFFHLDVLVDQRAILDADVSAQTCVGSSRDQVEQNDT